MSKHTVTDSYCPENFQDTFTELLRTGARKLIQVALESELKIFMETFTDRKLATGQAAVVRNGYHPERTIETGIGPVKVQVPKVRSKEGAPLTFHSALVPPPYVRKTARLEAALPWLYLKGISTGEMSSALEVLLGSQAKGLSASMIARLKEVWSEEYQHWNGICILTDRGTKYCGRVDQHDYQRY